MFKHQLPETLTTGYLGSKSSRDFRETAPGLVHPFQRTAIRTSNGFVWASRGNFSKYTATRSQSNLIWIRRVYDKFILAKNRLTDKPLSKSCPMKILWSIRPQSRLLKIFLLAFVPLFIHFLLFFSFFFSIGIHNNRNKTSSLICMAVTIQHCKSVERLIIR